MKLTTHSLWACLMKYAPDIKQRLATTKTSRLFNCPAAKINTNPRNTKPIPNMPFFKNCNNPMPFTFFMFDGTDLNIFLLGVLVGYMLLGLVVFFCIWRYYRLRLGGTLGFFAFMRADSLEVKLKEGGV